MLVPFGAMIRSDRPQINIQLVRLPRKTLNRFRSDDLSIQRIPHRVLISGVTVKYQIRQKAWKEERESASHV